MNLCVKTPTDESTSTSPTEMENPPSIREDKPYRIPKSGMAFTLVCLEEYMGRSQQNSRHTINASYNQCPTVTVSARHKGIISMA